MPEILTVKLNITNAETTADLKEAISAVPGIAITGNGSHCDALFMEIGQHLDQEFAFIEQIKSQGQAREIFLTSARKDPEVLLRALKAGIKEFFSQPLNKEEIIASLKKLRASRFAEGRLNAIEQRGLVISVIGSKGGVGATTVSVNLAVSLKEAAADKSVVLMDMNPLLGDIPLFLDIKTSFTWADGARDIARMDSTYLLNTLHKHQTGVQVLPAPLNTSGLEAATPDAMEKLVGRMRSAFDIIIMDGCRSFDELSLRMFAFSNTILVVTELNLPAVLNARKLLDTFEDLGLSYEKDIKVIVNRYEKKALVSPLEAEKALGRKIVSMISNDYETTMAAINNGRSLLNLAAKSPVARNFRELAALLLNKDAVQKENITFSSVLENLKLRAGLLPRREALRKDGSRYQPE